MSSASVAPIRPGQLARVGNRAAARLRAVLGRVSAPAALRSLAEMPLFVAGVACIDSAAFIGNLIAGLVVTGASLIGLEYLIADES